MDCNFKFLKEENGKKLFECSKCGYITTHQNAHRECIPIPQPQYEPSILKKIGNFSWAFGRHLYKGMPTVSQEILDKRLAICQECPLFKKREGMVGGICSHESCGCTIKDEIVFLNKIAWATESCPLDKWKAEK
jgi:hypothetical protein